VLQLARRGVVERIELDTHFFKGNAPQAVMVEWLDADGVSGDALLKQIAAPGSWQVLLESTPIVQHHRHVLEPAQPRPVTHLRVHIFPHGGVNRMRVFGHAVDTAGERQALATLNGLDAEARRALLLSFCGAKAFVDAAAQRFPAASTRDLFAAITRSFEGLSDDAWLEAFAAHPRLGASAAPREATAQSAAWSKGEQSGIARGDDDTLSRLQAGNDAYAKKHGFTFIAFASGRGAREVLELLESRLANDRATEIANAAREQIRITRQRVAVWLLANGAA
jgi:allantoicase